LSEAGVIEADYEGDYFYANNGAAELLVFRGGSQTHGVRAGVFDVNCAYPRSNISGSSLGFRSAYIPELEL